MKKIVALFVGMLLSTILLFGQDWECEDCPKRDIGLFDLDVWVDNPTETDSSPVGQKLYQTWVELFRVAGGIHYALFEDDPSNECIHYYDGQMSMLSGLDEQNYQHGNNQTSLPPAAGTRDEVDYWITGVIANQESDGLTIIKVYVQASGTGETVTEAVEVFDGTLSGFDAGKKIAAQLMPLMGKIRNFEKRKRDQEDIVAIDPDGKGATMELKPEKEKIKLQEKVQTTVKLIDCDGFPLKNIKVRLTSQGGSFSPKEVVTDSRGMAKATFTAGTIPGKFAQQFEFDFRFPYTFELNTSGDEGFITIEPTQYDATINVKKTYQKTLTTSCRDMVNKTVENHNLTESIQASATLYLTLTETMDMPVLNQTWQYFKPISVTVSSISYNSTENKFSSSEHHETNVEYNRIVKDQKLDGEETVKQIPWILVIDNETKKPVKLIPAGFGITYEIFESEVISSVKFVDGGTERETKTITRNRLKSFKLGPVGEEVPDPTIKTSDTWIQDYLKKQGVEIPAGVPIPNISNEETIKKIHPDILVKHGDGISGFGGDGDRRIPKELECGQQEEQLHYSWSVSRKRKNQ